MNDTRRVSLLVSPDLEKIVAAAQEAQISIQEVNFVRNTDLDILEALSILAEGQEEAQGYFSWLLAKSNLTSKIIA
jgi:hypothetical protein